MGIKTENISVGQTIKNYKVLCELLGEKAKEGKSKQLQLKDWERYFSFSRSGIKFVIEEIYEEPIPKIDNRGKSEGSRNNNMTYGKYIDSVLISCFKKLSEKEIPLYTTTNQLAHIVGMININYSTASSNKSKYFQYVFKELGEKVNKTAVWDVFSFIKSSTKYLIRSSLKRLTDKDLIIFEEAYILVHNQQTRIATAIEDEIIRDIEDKVLIDMGVPKRNILQYNDRLRNEYYENVEKLVKQKIENVDTLFIGYKIYIMLNTINEYGNEKEDRSELNTIFIRETKEKAEKLKAKYLKEYPHIGKPNPFWSEYVKDRLNENYIIYVEYVINSLCSCMYKDIRNDIINQIVIYKKKDKYKEMVNEFIENEQDEDMKDVWKSIF